MAIKCVLCRGKTRTIVEAVQSWKADHETAMDARELDDIVAECISAQSFLSSWVEGTWQQLFANCLDDPQTTGTHLREATDQALEVSEVVGGCIQEVEAHGYKIAAAATFQQGVEMIRHLRGDIAQRWPWMDERLALEALADYQAGRSQTAEEILDELHGSGGSRG